MIPDDEDSLSRVVSGLHSEKKDHYAFYYADIVSLARPGRFDSYWWVELFAGPGRLFVEPRSAYAKGSPVRSMEVRRPFDGYVFNDLDPLCIRALHPRIEGRGNAHLFSKDANSVELADAITELIPRSALVVVYADPAGLDLHYETLARLASRFPNLDLLLNFPVKQIVRALLGEQGRAASAGGDAKPVVDKARAVLGHPTPLDLVSGSRHTWGPTIRSWFQNRLAALRYQHFETQVITLHGSSAAIYDADCQP